MECLIDLSSHPVFKTHSILFLRPLGHPKLEVYFRVNMVNTAATKYITKYFTKYITKYITDYITERSNQAAFMLQGTNTNLNEIDQYQNAQYIGSSEAAWRILRQISGAGIMKLLNLQVSTDRQFDWSPVPFGPIKLSVSA